MHEGRQNEPGHWDAALAGALDGLDQLVYRSNLLGSDRSVANWGGGNTSAKLDEVDHAGRPSRVLRVKGSGSDLATIERKGFPGLRLDDLVPLEQRDRMPDAEMVDYLLRSGVDPSQARPSIETLLHAFIPASHVDHTHPDAIIALTAAPGGRRIAEEAFGDEAIWIDYIRPGFALSKLVAAAVREHPSARFVLLAKHGLVTWGQTGAESYAATMEAIARASRAIEGATRRNPFGSRVREPLEPELRRSLLLAALPLLRGGVSRERSQILQVDSGPEVLEFLAGDDARRLSQIGAACPDHLVNTKVRPLWVDWDGATEASLETGIREGIVGYETWYRSYHEGHVDAESAPFPLDPLGPRVTLIPGIGMITAGRDATRADVSAQLYHRAIEVLRLSAGISDFTSLTDAEAFAVEYWPLERYKLSLAPPPRELEGRVALVTGGASGIGRATAELLAAQGAHVAIADLDGERAEEVARALVERHGSRRAIAVRMNVGDEGHVQAGFDDAVLEWGGVDIVVSNAGIALAANLVDTTLEVWDRNFDVLGRGYFLVAREAVRRMAQQGAGGSLVFVASKNGLVAGKGAAAYSAAKAAEIHLARCVAEEVGVQGIRVNVVNPDAVIRGSGIWNSAWREERARNYGIGEDELEEHYRQRTTLKVNVLPEDIAEAILYFASGRSLKSTGNILNVDGGVAAAYPR